MEDKIEGPLERLLYALAAYGKIESLDLGLWRCLDPLFSTLDLLVEFFREFKGQFSSLEYLKIDRFYTFDNTVVRFELFYEAIESQEVKPSKLKAVNSRKIL